MPESSSSEQWVLGVILGLLGSIAINTGNNIQSLGLLKAQKDRDGRRSTIDFAQTVPIDKNGNSTCSEKFTETEEKPYASIIWIIGTAVFVTGSLLNFASYAFAAQSMLASLESIQFVTNLIFGKFMLKAHITRRMVIGTVLTVAGTILAVQFSSKTTLTLNTAEMVQLYKNPAYIVYLLLSLVTIGLMNYVYKWYKGRIRQRRPLPHSDIVMPLSYSVLSALVGTQSVVQAKLLAELLSVQSSGRENVFKSSFVYITIIFWLLTVVVWLSRLNNALSKFDPLFMIPLLQCSFVFFAIISGGIFFKEFDSFSNKQWLGFWSGICVMFSGLTMLIPKHVKVKECIDNESVAMEELTEGFQDKNATENDKFTSSTSPIDVQNEIWASSGAQTDYSFDNVRGARQLKQAVVSAFVESAQNVVSKSSVLLTPPNSTTVVTQAMMATTIEMVKSNHNRDYELTTKQDLTTMKRLDFVDELI